MGIGEFGLLKVTVVEVIDVVLSLSSKVSSSENVFSRSRCMHMPMVVAKSNRKVAYLVSTFL